MTAALIIYTIGLLLFFILGVFCGYTMFSNNKSPIKTLEDIREVIVPFKAKPVKALSAEEQRKRMTKEYETEKAMEETFNDIIGNKDYVTKMFGK